MSPSSEARTGRRVRGRIALALGAAALLGASVGQAATLGGVEVEDTLQAGGTSLQLNGAGLRSRFFIKLYVAGLYTEQGEGSARAILLADAPMAITLDIVSDRVTRDKMIEALNDGFATSTGGDIAPVAEGMAQLESAMGDTMSAGSSMTFAYEPGVGTRVLRDGTEAALIEGLDFKQALFGIWLSDSPVDGKLKGGLLDQG